MAKTRNQEDNQKPDGGFEEGSEKTATGEIPQAPGTGVAIRGNANANEVQRALAAMGASETKALALPVLVLKTPGSAVAVLIREAMHVSDFAKPGEKPATICAVADITTGQQSMFLVPSVVADTIRREYPKVDADGNELTPPPFKADRNEKDEVTVSVREKEIEWLDSQPGTWPYVGKTFYIETVGQRQGKRYKDFIVKEMHIPKKTEA